MWLVVAIVSQTLDEARKGADRTTVAIGEDYAAGTVNSGGADQAPNS